MNEVSSRRGQRGMVTAEAAIAIPTIALFALALIWFVTVAIADVRVVDAARDAARALARGEDPSSAVAAARRTAGPLAAVRFRRDHGLVVVDVAETVRAPGWLLVPLPAMTVRSQSSVEVEDDRPTE